MSAIPAKAGSLWDRAPGLISLRDFMEQFHVAPVVAMFANLVRVTELLHAAPAAERVPPEIAEVLEQDVFVHAEALCGVAGLRHSLVTLSRLRMEFSAGIRHGAAGQGLTHFNDLLVSELNDCNLFLMPKGRASYYRSERFFGDAVFDAFPSARPDVAEAGSCYATGCHTASVFHCMRALEHGLRAFALEVGRTYDREQWANIIDQIEVEIAKVRKNGIAGMSKAKKDDNLRFWSEAAKEFSYFKDGWRNHVVHARASYDENSALSLLHHTRNFMTTLSDAGLKE